MTDKKNASTPETNPSAADMALKDAMGKFTHLIVVGLDEAGKLDIIPTVHQYPFLQWLLNKAQFELHLHERSQPSKATTVDES